MADLLTRKNRLLASRTGEAHLNLKTIADLDIDTDRGIDLSTSALVTDAMAVLTDGYRRGGGTHPGRHTPGQTVYLAALENGKHVVTANKALLSPAGVNW